MSFAEYGPIATAAARQFGIDPAIFTRQIQAESGFNTGLTSSAGARGIAQFMPETAAGLGINPDDPHEALYGAAALMRSYLDRYGNDYPKALAAYNAGAGNVDQYGGVPPFSETQTYVQNILGQQSPNGGPGGTMPIDENQIGPLLERYGYKYVGPVDGNNHAIDTGARAMWQQGTWNPNAKPGSKEEFTPATYSAASGGGTVAPQSQEEIANKLFPTSSPYLKATANGSYNGSGLPAGYVQGPNGIVMKQTGNGLVPATPQELAEINAPKPTAPVVRPNGDVYTFDANGVPKLTGNIGAQAANLTTFTGANGHLWTMNPQTGEQRDTNVQVAFSQQDILDQQRADKNSGNLFTAAQNEANRNATATNQQNANIFTAGENAATRAATATNQQNQNIFTSGENALTRQATATNQQNQNIFAGAQSAQGLNAAETNQLRGLGASAIDNQLSRAAQAGQFAATYGLNVAAQQRADRDAAIGAAKTFSDLSGSADLTGYDRFLAAGGGSLGGAIQRRATSLTDRGQLGAARALQTAEQPLPTYAPYVAPTETNPYAQYIPAVTYQSVAPQVITSPVTAGGAPVAPRVAVGGVPAGYTSSTQAEYDRAAAIAALSQGHNAVNTATGQLSAPASDSTPGYTERPGGGISLSAPEIAAGATYHDTPTNADGTYKAYAYGTRGALGRRTRSGVATPALGGGMDSLTSRFAMGTGAGPAISGSESEYGAGLTDYQYKIGMQDARKGNAPLVDRAPANYAEQAYLQGYQAGTKTEADRQLDRASNLPDQLSGLGRYANGTRFGDDRYATGTFLTGDSTDPMDPAAGGAHPEMVSLEDPPGENNARATVTPTVPPGVGDTTGMGYDGDGMDSEGAGDDDRTAQLGALLSALGKFLATPAAPAGMPVQRMFLGTRRRYALGTDPVTGASNNPITAEDQPYIDRVMAMRQATPGGYDVNPYAASYLTSQLPTQRNIGASAFQVATGVPKEDLQATANYYQPVGLSRDSPYRSINLGQ